MGWCVCGCGGRLPLDTRTKVFLPLAARLTLTARLAALAGAPSVRMLLVFAPLAFRIEGLTTFVALELLGFLFALLHR